MALDTAQVAKIAHLARIRLTEEECEAFAGDLSNILGWIEQLREVETTDVEPMTSVVDVDLPMREDAVTDGGYPDRILANAPETTAGYFVVPKVVE